MALSPEKAETTPCVTQSDLSWIEKRVDRLSERHYEDIKKLETKIKLLVRILVDKKIIGTELAKTFEEAKGIDIDKIREWYEGSRKPKK